MVENLRGERKMKNHIKSSAARTYAIRESVEKVMWSIVGLIIGIVLTLGFSYLSMSEIMASTTRLWTVNGYKYVISEEELNEYEYQLQRADEENAFLKETIRNYERMVIKQEIRPTDRRTTQEF